MISHYMQYLTVIDDKSSDNDDADSVASDSTEEQNYDQYNEENEIHTIEELMVKHIRSFVQYNPALANFIIDFIDIFNAFIKNP